MTLRIGICTLLILAALTAPVLAETDTCSAPTIYVVQITAGDGISTETATLLNLRYAQELQEANPGVRVSSAAEIGELLQAERDELLAGRDAGAEQIAIGEKISAEYVTRLSIGSVGSRYVISSSLVDEDLIMVVARGYTTVDTEEELTNAITEHVAGYGDLAALIQAHEKRHPVPPRGPSLSATINPTSVTPEDIRETTTITVTVTNCAGEPVPGTRVYFEAITSRGQVIGEGESKDPGWYGWQYAVTDQNGKALATYQLVASKGMGAGKDTVTIGTDGRGGKDVRTRVTIPITGVMMEVRVADPEIPPEGKTDITVSLFELAPDASRRPLADRALLVEEVLLSDGVRVIVAGKTDSKGNPITDANGEVRLTFIAGTKEGTEVVRILFQDVGRGHMDALVGLAEIRVKKEEYTGTVNWKESGTMAYEFSFQHMHDLIDYEYAFSLTGQTTKEKFSGKEQTDASYTFTNSYDLFTSGYTPYEVSPTSERTEIVPFEETWRVDSTVLGQVDDYQTVNRMMNEKFSSWEIPVIAYPVSMPATGSHEYDVTVTYIVHGTEHTGSASGTIPASGTVTLGGRQPMTDIQTDSLPAVSPDSPDAWPTRTLMLQGAGIDDKMTVLRDAKIAGLLVQTGKNVYERSWSSRDAGSYHDSLFTFLGSDARMDLEQSFTRDVSLRVVKL